MPSAARAFLALENDPGCGAEYGRHSKSIDPDKHRCGKCKGLLIQVRPKPRKVDLARKSPRKVGAPFKKKVTGEPEDLSVPGGSIDGLNALQLALEVVGLSD